MVEVRKPYRPKGSENIQEFLYVHELKKDGKVSCAPFHGGFMMNIPLEEFNNLFEIASEELIDSLKSIYFAADFSIGDDATYDDRIPGFTNGQLWNGWQMPLFRREIIEKAIEDQAMNTPHWMTIIFDEGALNISCQGWGNAKPLPEDRSWDDLKEIVMRDEEVYELDLGDGLIVSADWFSAETINVNGEEIKVYPVGSGYWTWELAPEAPSHKP